MYNALQFSWNVSFLCGEENVSTVTLTIINKLTDLKLNIYVTPTALKCAVMYSNRVFNNSHC